MTMYRPAAIIALAVTLLIPLCLKADATETTIYEYDSVYHHIRVTQDGDNRYLRFDNSFYQTKMNVEDPLTGHFHYLELLFQTYLFNEDIDDILVLGMGGGSIQRLMNHYRPEVDIMTVELDEAVLDTAVEYFYYDRVTNPVEISDARRWLRYDTDTYDLIIQDTYTSTLYGTFIPFHLATIEYFQIVTGRLADDGLYAVNVIGTIYGGESNRVITSVYKTMDVVFENLYMFAAVDSQNVVIIGSMDPERKSAHDLQIISNTLFSDHHDSLPPGFIGDTWRFYDVLPTGIAGAVVLTDDYAPTDNLLR